MIYNVSVPAERLGFKAGTPATSHFFLLSEVVAITATGTARADLFTVTITLRSASQPLAPVLTGAEHHALVEAWRTFHEPLHTIPVRG